MARYQMYNPRPVWLDLAGVENIPGGSLTFYAIGTTNPQDTYNARSGGTANSNPVVLDSSGRANTNIWLLGEYSILVKDADGVTVSTFDMDSGNDAAQTIPLNDPDHFTGGDGAQFLSIDLSKRLIPDGTGAVGMVPIIIDEDGTVGLVELPEAPPAPELPIESTSTVLKVGTFMIQIGTGTVSAAPTAKTNAVNITFGEAFTGTPMVFPSNATPGGSTPSGACAVMSSSAESTTGATITANIPDDDTNNNWKLGNATNFKYIAIGPCVSPDA